MELFLRVADNFANGIGGNSMSSFCVFANAVVVAGGGVNLRWQILYTTNLR